MMDLLGSESALEKSAQEVAAPLPSELAPNVRSFERWVSGGLVSLLGLNTFLVGCLQIARIGADSKRYSALTSLTLGIGSSHGCWAWRSWPRQPR